MRALLETMQDNTKAGLADVLAELADVRAEVANLRVETRKGNAALVQDVREVKIAVAALNQRVANVETADQ